MGGNEGGFEWSQVANWLWQNREWVAAKIREVREWLFPPEGAEETRKLLIIGPGGVGKSTTARMLSGQYRTLLDVPGAYQESIGLESYVLEDDAKVELVVPPGQRHRRDATWGGLQAAIGSGDYRGIIVLGAFGYHSLGQISYKHHRLYQGDEARFLRDFLEECRADEVGVLRRLSPHVCANSRKCWIMTLVTKQDLWWHEHQRVEDHYRAGEYGSAIDEMIGHVGKSRLRHEFVFASLTISNFATGVGELLAPTASGYDQNLQVQSLHRVWETLLSLKNWEERL